MTEQEIFDKALERPDTILFRNDNCGGYHKDGTFFNSGLLPGSGDLIGWTEIIITPEMVNEKVAVFTSIEAKTLNDKMSDKQKKWFINVCKAGGIAIVLHEQKDGTIKEITKL